MYELRIKQGLVELLVERSDDKYRLRATGETIADAWPADSEALIYISNQTYPHSSWQCVHTIRKPEHKANTQ